MKQQQLRHFICSSATDKQIERRVENLSCPGDVVVQLASGTKLWGITGCRCSTRNVRAVLTLACGGYQVLSLQSVLLSMHPGPYKIATAYHYAFVLNHLCCQDPSQISKVPELLYPPTPPLQLTKGRCVVPVLCSPYGVYGIQMGMELCRVCAMCSTGTGMVLPSICEQCGARRRWPPTTQKTSALSCQ
eukprot:2201237-Rhodomonas_salina.1